MKCQVLLFFALLIQLNTLLTFLWPCFDNKQLGVNALDAMVHAYNGLALVRQQTAPTSRIHCVITNGGAAANSKQIPFLERL